MDERGIEMGSREFLLAEYETLRGLRSDLASQGESRVNVFVAIVSGGLAGLTVLVRWLASPNSGELHDSFPALTVVILVGLLLLGVITFGRSLERAIGVTVYTRGLNRLRRYFAERDPGILAYLSQPTCDSWPRFGGMGLLTRGGHYFGLSSMVAVVNSVMMGAVVSLCLETVTQWAWGWVLFAAMLTLGTSILWHRRYMSVRFRKAEDSPQNTARFAEEVSTVENQGEETMAEATSPSAPDGPARGGNTGKSGKCCVALGRYIKKRWTELLMRFVITLIGVFLAVWSGLLVDAATRQKVADEASAARMHAVYLELNPNIVFARDMFELASEQDTYITRQTGIRLFAADLALHDDNLFRFLSPEAVMLLEKYIDTGRQLDARHREYLEFFRDSGYHIAEDEEPLAEAFNSKLADQAATFGAVSAVLQEELPKYFDKSVYAEGAVQDAKEEREARIESYRQRILMGEYKRRGE